MMRSFLFVAISYQVTRWQAQGEKGILFSEGKEGRKYAT